MADRFAGAPHPGNWLIQLGSPHASRYHADLVDRLLRCGLPAAQRAGAIRATLVRRGLIPALLPIAHRTLPGKVHPDMEVLRAGLAQHWHQLHRQSARLPETAPQLSFLALRRPVSSVVFVFGEDAHPLLVCKVPHGDAAAVDREAAKLRSVEGLWFVPRFLGQVGLARVQEGMPGSPMALAPLAVSMAVAAQWSPELEDAVRALRLLAQHQASTEARAGAWTFDPRLESLVSRRSARRIMDAATRLRYFPQVWSHNDFSPQNVLLTGDRVTGVIDWETARVGPPGWDILNLAHSVFEQRLGLARWRENEVAGAFRAAWAGAPLFRVARDHAAGAVGATGLSPELTADLEILFYADRLHDALVSPHGSVVQPPLAAQYVDHVCDASG